MRLVLEHVYAGYGSGEQRQVLKDLSFSIEEGKSVSIVGPNGSGKTTLLKVLSGILPYEGSIRLEMEMRDSAKLTAEQAHSNSYRLRDLPRKELSRKIALMPQFSEVYFSYSVEDTVLLGRYVHSDSRLGVPSQRDKEVVDRCLQMTGVEDLRKRSVDELSGGQQQRVFLARTFAQETPFILLDEPTNHLDLRYQKELMEQLQNWEKGTTAGVKNTLIGVFHDITLALEGAEELIFLKEGKLAAKGKAQEVLTTSLLKEVYDMDVAAEMKQRYELWSHVRG